MKTFIHQALILGGLYFVASLIVSVLRFLDFGTFWGLVNVVVFIVFAAMFLILCFKTKYNFLARFQNKYIKTSAYLEALGIARYYQIIFMVVPGVVYGYQASKAQYLGLEIPPPPIMYMQVVSYAYWGVLLFSLIWATYRSFGKKIKYSR